MPPTITAPIRDSRVNQYLFVGETGARTIQRAVTLAVAEGGGFAVLIPPGYAGADTIAGVTGGAANVYLCDQRGTSWQMYAWSGTAYVAADFIQQRGFIATGFAGDSPLGSATIGFDPNGTTGNGSADLLVTSNPGRGAPGFNLQMQSADGSLTLHTFLRADVSATTQRPEVVIPNDLHVIGPLSASGGATVAGGLNADNVTVSNNLIVNKELDVLGGAEVQGDLAVSGSVLLANDPTLANEATTKHYVDEAIAESGNFVYPGPGITTSTGTEWGTPIDPATVIRTTPNQPYINSIVKAAAFTADGFNTAPPVNTASYQWATPNAVITAYQAGAVKGGVRLEGWSSAPSAEKIYLDCQDAGATFGPNYPVAIPGILTAGQADADQFNHTTVNTELIVTDTSLTWLIAVLPPPTLSTSDCVHIRALAGQVATAYEPALLDIVLRARSSTFYHTRTGGIGAPQIGVVCFRLADGSINVTVVGLASPTPFQQINLSITLDSNDVTVVSPAQPLPAGSPGVICYNTIDEVAYPPLLAVNGTGSPHSRWSPAYDAAIDLPSGADIFAARPMGLYHCHDGALNSPLGGQGDIYWYNFGYMILSWGHNNGANQVFYTTNFVNTGWYPWALIGGSLVTAQQPEGIRGEVKCVGGKAEVTLPEDFEGRSVQLTQVEDESAKFASLMASRVAGGKFRIRSSVADATVWWEVRASRDEPPPNGNGNGNGKKARKVK